MNTEVVTETKRAIDLPECWLKFLKPEFEKDYMGRLKQFLTKEISNHKIIYPHPSQWFAALRVTGFYDVKVVILGQDPYHGPGQAHGLSFSVPPGVPAPPSLVNMFKELHQDLGIAPTRTGYLLPWAKQGVLLLNSVLTVEAGKAASHQGQGWELFTDACIRALAEERTGLAFVLWGSYAQKKGAFIDRNRHLVLESPHPSPLSAHRGFLGSKPYSKINKWLQETGQNPIDWQL